jgi:hypothetical protein
MSRPYGGTYLKVSPQNQNAMYELFITMLDQLFYEGYAEQLAHDNPTAFNFEYQDFLNNYCNEVV